jgi:hypothetical protein
MEKRSIAAQGFHVVGMAGVVLVAGHLTQGVVDYWPLSGRFQQHQAIAHTLALIALYLAPLAFVALPDFLRAVKLIAFGSASTAAAMGLVSHSDNPTRDSFFVLAVAVSLVPMLAAYVLPDFFIVGDNANTRAKDKVTK